MSTLDKLTLTGFNGSYQNCGWISNRSIANGECQMWGNPVAEMLFESVRYYAGKASPTLNLLLQVGLMGRLIYRHHLARSI